MKIIETDNFNGDYPNEKFLALPPDMNEAAATEICEAINKHCSGSHSPRYWRVVAADYVLQPGFEP